MLAGKMLQTTPNASYIHNARAAQALSQELSAPEKATLVQHMAEHEPSANASFNFRQLKAIRRIQSYFRTRRSRGPARVCLVCEVL